tara:strand:+ start:333 stop:509 length:177 start_codon:yes stop_codon:yes gene_type:complete
MYTDIIFCVKVKGLGSQLAFQLGDFLPKSYTLSDGEDAVLDGFPKDRDFNFDFVHNFF